jgi:hypothetical protein
MMPMGMPVLLLEEPRIVGRLFAHPGASGPRVLLVSPDRDPAIPDLLAYWSPVAGDGQVLPQQAILLGALRGSRDQLLSLPDREDLGSGRIVLYSHGWNRVLSNVNLPGWP